MKSWGSLRYASQPGLPPDHSTPDSGWWPALTGQGSHLLGRTEGFHQVYSSTWLPPSPDLAWRNNRSLMRNHAEDLPARPTRGNVLGDLPDADRFQTLIEPDAVALSAFSHPSMYEAEPRCFTTMSDTFDTYGSGVLECRHQVFQRHTRPSRANDASQT